MNSLRRIVCSGVAAAAAFGLVGCGYRLAGTGGSQGRVFSPLLKRVSVEGLGRYQSFRKTLVAILRSYGIGVTSPWRASARLVFSEYTEHQKRAAVGDDVKAREYILTVEALFNVVSTEDSSAVLAGQTVRAEAAYLSDPDLPLLTASEKRAVLGDVENELCRKILLRLATLKA